MLKRDGRYPEYGLKYLAFLFLVLIVYRKFGPLDFRPVHSGGDASWQAALAYGVEHGLIFGKDVVFTGGPLSSLYTRQFNLAFAYPIAVLSIIIVIFIALVWTLLLARRINMMQLASMSLILWLTIIPGDTLLLLVPLLTGLKGLENENIRGTAITLLGAALSGIIILAKFSVFPIAILAVVIIDFFAITRKRFPLHAIGLLIGLCGGFVACGHPLARLPGFLKASLEVSSGYSSAMSFKIQIIDLLAWLLFLGIFIVGIYPSEGHRQKGPSANLGRLILIAGFIFVVFKAGFVRHDLHSLIAWGGLSSIVTLAGMSFGDLPLRAVRNMTVLACVLILPGQILTFRAEHRFNLTNLVGTPSSAYYQLDDAWSFLTRPASWLANHKSINDASLADMRRQVPLPILDGTVDVIQSVQSNIIASGMNYRPRPTIQEYTSYSPALIARNRAFFLGEASPDYLVMAPGSIDNRHPASAEGALWPLFFSRYEVAQQSRLGLILRKRQFPLSDIQESPVEQTARFGEEVEFPETGKAWMVSIDIQPTLLGHLANLLYRPPRTEIIINYKDGHSRRYYLIPGMISEGMLLTPLVNSLEEYQMLASGHAQSGYLKHARSFMVLGSGIFYRRELPVKFIGLKSELLQAKEDRAPL